MEQLVPVVAKLQDVLGAVGAVHGEAHLDLPQIVVVGGQSSGKSSVLEGIVGRSFLPRGSGIVTRRPLVLQLYNTALPIPHQATGERYEDAREDLGHDQHDDGGGRGNGGNAGAGGPRGRSNPSHTPTRPPAGGAGGNGNPPPRSTTRAAGLDDDNSRPGDEWGEFLHLPGKRYYDFGAIRDEIVLETDRLTGSNRGISSQPLHLKIFSPKVLHLTLVDLPGIAKVAVGDQPPDIEEQIREMCLSYMSNPNAIILAVTAANTDLANSDAIQMARMIDPGGDRTIGVLTKLDLMDPGTDVADVLQNRVIPLQRGYVAVVNRGQLDIDRDKSIRDGLKKESDFFRGHPAYRTVQGKCGTANLARSLNSVLMHHIRECLPELKNRIMSMLADVQVELDALGNPTDDASRSNLSHEMLTLLSKFASSFRNCVDGRGTSREGLELNELFGGARVGFIFNEVFVRSLMAVRPFDGLSDEEIRTTICNANGTRAALFVPEISFDILVRRQIARLEQPGLQCVDLVYNELQRIAAQCEPNEFQRFPALRDRMLEVVSGVLRRCVAPTHMMVSNLVKIELAYINTSHPDFIGGSKAVARLMDKMGKAGDAASAVPSRGGAGPRRSSSMGSVRRSIGDDDAASTSSALARGGGGGGLDDHSLAATGGQLEHADVGVSTTGAGDAGGGGGIMNFIFRSKKDLTNRPPNSAQPPTVVQLPQVPDTMRNPDLPTERERIETEIIKSLIESYFGIVRKNFIDMVPKTIMYFLVNHARDSMQNELVSELYRDALVPELMREADDIAQRRQTCQEMRELLQKALEIVNEVRDFNTFK